MWIPIMPRVSESKTTFGFWSPRCGLWIPCTGFQKVDIRFQIPIIIVGFWSPKPRVPDSTWQNFLDPGFHKQTSPSTCREDYTKMQPDQASCGASILTTPENTITYHRIRGARVVQWWSTSLPPMWPRFESWRWRHMWVEFVVGSLPCSERFFAGVLQFSSLLKN